MRKRLLAFLLALAIAVIWVPALAEVGAAVFTVETQETVVGNTVALRVSARANGADGQRLNTWRGAFSYDPQALEYVGFVLEDETTRETTIAGLDSVWAVNDSVPGYLEIGFSNAFGCTEDGYLVTILLRALKTGSYTIDLKDVVYSTYRPADGGVSSYTKVDETVASVTIYETMPTESPSPTPVATDTPSPSPTGTPTAKPTQKPTATPDDDDDEYYEPTRKPTATPTRKPRQTPTTNPTASPTALPTATPAPTPDATPQPTTVPTDTSNATASPLATSTPYTGRLLTDGEGGCNNSSLGILILDIGIAFLALQMIIVVLIILRKRKQPKNDFLDDESDEEDMTEDDLDFTDDP